MVPVRLLTLLMFVILMCILTPPSSMLRQRNLSKIWKQEAAAFGDSIKHNIGANACIEDRTRFRLMELPEISYKANRIMDEEFTHHIPNAYTTRSVSGIYKIPISGL